MLNMVFFGIYLICWKFIVEKIEMNIYWNTLAYDQ